MAKEAGLNPALLYKQGGSSGQTQATNNSQNSATYQRGAAAGNVWAAGIQGAMLESQIEVNKAQANALDADAEAKRTYAKDKAVAETNYTQTLTKYQETLNEIQNDTKTDQKLAIKAEAGKQMGLMNSALAKGEIDQSTISMDSLLIVVHIYPLG